MESYIFIIQFKIRGNIMTKKSKTTYGVLTEAAGLYFSNISKFLKYMTFPILGQTAGLILIFAITYFYAQNFPKLIKSFPALNNLSTLVLISLLITLPGLIIYLKAFWEYLVAYGAVNSMLDNMLKSGRVYDFDAHTELIKRRSLPFVGLWLLVGIFSLVASCPLFWVICGILAVYFVLIFQVFTYEPELSPIGCARKSLLLIKGHFGSTFFLLCSIGLLTYLFIPQIFIKIFELLNVNAFLSGAILPLVNMLPEIDLVKYGLKPLTQSDIALFTVQAIIAQILIGYTLPMRSILWGLWYKKLNKEMPSGEKKTKRRTKRPSEKLMEESSKKFGKKKIDDNILRRAMEKDEEN